jgi:AmiR/NasT family two-component response regulator
MDGSRPATSDSALGPLDDLDALRRAYDEAQELIVQLQDALESRDVIGQAKGILMAREGCAPDAAFEMLRARSQQRNVKLRDVASEIVAAVREPRT